MCIPSAPAADQQDGGGGEGAVRPATDTGRERTAPMPVPAGDTDPESCSLLGLIEVVRACLDRLPWSLREMCSLLSGTADVIVVVQRGSVRIRCSAHRMAEGGINGGLTNSH
jgi:hypothetical protein